MNREEHQIYIRKEIFPVFIILGYCAATEQHNICICTRNLHQTGIRLSFGLRSVFCVALNSICKIDLGQTDRIVVRICWFLFTTIFHFNRLLCRRVNTNDDRDGSDTLIDTEHLEQNNYVFQSFIFISLLFLFFVNRIETISWTPKMIKYCSNGI